MPHMIATGLKEYPPGHALFEGERFHVERAHVIPLLATGLAKVADAGAPPIPYVTRDMAAAPAAQYETRDVVAKRGRGRPRKVVE